MIKQEILELLEHADNETIFAFIAEYAEEDNNFYNKIKQTLLPDEAEDICSLDYYRMEAGECFEFDYSGRRSYRYDFYEAAYEAASGLSKMLGNATFFVEQRKYSEAAAIAMSVAEVIPRNYENVDDSYGALGDNFNEAAKILCDIINNPDVPISIKKEIYEWVKKETNESVYLDYGFEDLEKVYDSCCEQLGDTETVIADFDKKIEKANHYTINELILRKISFMLSRNVDAEDVIQKYIHLDGVRKLKFEELKNAKKYDEALILAKNGIEIAKQNDYIGNIADWEKAVYEIYLLQGDIEKLLPMSEYLFFNAGWCDNPKDYYDTLKKYTPTANWQNTLERLLKKAEEKSGFESFTAKIMQENKLWQRLFNYCKKGCVQNMEEYEKDLKPYFEKEILDFYYNCAEKKALLSNDNAYNEVARILKKMKTFSGGNVLVEQLLEKYRTTHKRRKNMMKVLNGV